MRPASTVISERPCRRCGETLQLNDCYCPRCGWNQRRPYFRVPLTFRSFAALALVTAGLWGVTRLVQLGMPLGAEPAEGPTQSASAAPAQDDAELVALRGAAQKTPNDKEGWKDLARALSARVESAPTPSSGQIFELIDALQEVLRIDPRDADALLGMANASFENRVMDKAGGYYARYLEIKPDDLDARARYGSVLSLNGEFAKAQSELRAVLAKEPKNFSATAYLALSYAQQGDLKRAKEIGDKALALAPSDDARKQFGDFLSRLLAGKPEAAEAAAGGKGEAGEAETVAGYVRDNPVAGPKFERFEEAGDTVRVFLRDFPMKSMPPFARDKFLSGIRAKAAQRSVKKISKLELRDGSNGELMEVVKLP